ncbi:PREDICTED: dentin sialophosphoprotein isoform X4 [Populus euphratica]|uniref:Dentin sialophosphoprotein isoform X4 n=1 Tax=Populus euphratica TaxID=75702 RepID=A0AAJ6X7E2_POPEU|nr:PREDICTED: dentin sialophosphoprotein isoform X4 [Populus euphratica]
MYGGSSKRGGRGGGGSGPRRSSLPPPPPVHRFTPSSRLSLGSTNNNPRNNRPGPINAKSSSSSNPGVEETFSLIPGNNPLAFAMIIRLAPDLVDEIRRIEAQGGTARIKFGSMANNPDGNVIDVGGKEFRFTWSRELGDLCDIYEERQGGVDGNGLLVESGCAWRKVNVQRVLDESTKNHVKMLSEEAERKFKSRKAIVLDQGNPAAKSQIKQLAAVESNPWFKRKIEPSFKKRKVEPPQVGGGGFPKTTYKPALPSTAIVKGRLSSPLPSPPEHSGAPASPFGTGSITKHHVSTEEYIPTQMKNKENAASSENEIPAKFNSALWETPGRKGNLGVKAMDLQSMLVNLLIQNPKGMSLKALEKAVSGTIPNSAKKIEPIIKKIANFQAPGRYILKPGMESEKVKKPSSESGSSPEDNHQQAHATEDNCCQRPDPEPRFAEKNPSVASKELVRSNSKLGEESNALEKLDIDQSSPDLFGEKKVSDNSEGQAGSSSDSGSDSDSESDSSDSGSDSGSRSRSRSRSPVGSGTGSSSDSESDASSNSKQGSDEDVDIMTSDDDKEPRHKLQTAEPGLLASPDPWRSVPNGIDKKLDGNKSAAVDIEGHGSAAVDIEGHESDAIEIEGHESDAIEVDKDLAGDEKDIKITKNDSLVTSKEGEKPLQGPESTFHDHDMIQERQMFIGNLFDDDDNMVRDSFRHEQSDSSDRTSKSKSKRGLDAKPFDSKSERVKRLKAESLSRVPTSKGRDTQFSGSPHDKHNEDMYKGPAIQVMDRADKQASDFGSEKLYNQAISGKSNPDFQQSGRRSSDQNARLKAQEAASRSKHAEGSGISCKFPEKGSFVHEVFSIHREKASRDTQNEDTFSKEKKVPINSKEGGAGGKHSASFDSHYRKQGEAFGRPKDPGQISNSNFGFSPKDSNRADMEKHRVASGRGLHRELSDLELGELREPLLEETPVKKRFERKGSFKHSENKSSTSDNCNSDIHKGKSIGKVSLDSGKPSPNLSAGVKRSPEHRVDDLTRPNHKAMQSQPQHVSSVDNLDVGSGFSKLADSSSRLTQNETSAKLGNSMEGYGESHKKAPLSAQKLHESKCGTLPHLINGRKDTLMTEDSNNVSKKRESSSEDDSSSYSKYEKDAPELRGPIKDFSQYQEYVQEYRDKYDSYCSLNRILESYRNEFHKLGKDLESAKGRDMDRYHNILVQLKESYSQCGMKHRRLKKIFIVLHKELEQLKQRIKDFVPSYTKD